MRHRLRVLSISISLAMLLLGLLAFSVYADYGACRYWGTLKVNGVNPTSAQKVSAWINGVKYAEVMSGSLQGQNPWDYLIDIPADNLQTLPPQIEGGKTGDTVLFKVEGIDANPTTQWLWGGFININLEAQMPTRLEGDVNNDGVINSGDALLVAKHIVGTTTLTGDNLLAADVNDDQLINGADLLLIKKYIVGTINQFPGGVYIP